MNVIQIKQKLKALKLLILGRSKFGSLYLASACLQRGIMKAKELNSQDGHRYFLVWDPNARDLFPITFDYYKDRGDSFQYLRHRGRMNHMTREELKNGSFYYTGSKNGAKEMRKDVQQKRLDLLRRKYFTTK